LAENALSNVSAVLPLFLFAFIRIQSHAVNDYKMLSYRTETALQGALVLAKRGRLELENNTLRTL